jgi:hypothetical protein
MASVSGLRHHRVGEVIMSVLRKVKTALIVVFGIPCLILVVGVGVHEYFKGQGELHVLAPQADRVSVDIDGELAGKIPAGQHEVFDVSRGTHTVDITVGGGDETVSYAFEAKSGFWHGVAPASADQCLAQLEVSETYYEGAKVKDGMLPLPRLEDRFRGGDGGAGGAGSGGAGGVVTLNGSVYFSEEALPNEIDEGSKIYLVFEIPCALMDAPDQEVVVSYLGFMGYEKKGLLAR